MSVTGGDAGVVQASEEAPRGSTLGRYLAVKAGGSLISLIMVVVLGFFAFRVLPGDPAITMTRGRRVSAEEVDRLREQMGFNDPILVQFWHYLTDLARGDLGTSYVFQDRSISSLILDYLGPTILLTGTAAVISIVLGLWLGQRAGWKRGSLMDKSNSMLALTFWSVPTFWLGVLLLVFFGGVFPTTGMSSEDASFSLGYVLDVAHHMVLPVITMVAVAYAQYFMVMRASVLEEMNADYLTTARAKGLREDLVRTRHAVPNALLPTVTLIFLTLGTVIGGAVTVESVYTWPGLGYLTYQALSQPDLPLLQGTFVVFSTLVIVTNFLADLVYRLLDPRLKAA